MLGAIDVFFLATQRRTTPFLQVRLMFFFSRNSEACRVFLQLCHREPRGARSMHARKWLGSGWDHLNLVARATLSKHVIIRPPASVTTARNIPTYQSLTFGIGAHPLPWVVIAGPTKTFMLLVIAIAKPTYISLT